MLFLLTVFFFPAAAVTDGGIVAAVVRVCFGALVLFVGLVNPIPMRRRRRRRRRCRLYLRFKDSVDVEDGFVNKS